MDLKKILPKLYLELNEKGATDIKNYIEPEETNKVYLWFFNMTWLTFIEIATENYDFLPDDLVPFAFDVGGDYWCIKINQEGAMPIVRWFHDDGTTKFYTRTFEEALFREILDFAQGAFEENQLEQFKKIMEYWIEYLKEFFPKEWIEEMRCISSAKNLPLKLPEKYGGDGTIYWFLNDEQYSELIEKYLKFSLMDKEYGGY